MNQTYGRFGFSSSSDEYDVSLPNSQATDSDYDYTSASEVSCPVSSSSSSNYSTTAARFSAPRYPSRGNRYRPPRSFSPSSASTVYSIGVPSIEEIADVSHHDYENLSLYRKPAPTSESSASSKTSTTYSSSSSDHSSTRGRRQGSSRHAKFDPVQVPLDVRYPSTRKRSDGGSSHRTRSIDSVSSTRAVATGLEPNREQEPELRSSTPAVMKIDDEFSVQPPFKVSASPSVSTLTRRAFLFGGVPIVKQTPSRNGGIPKIEVHSLESREREIRAELNNTDDTDYATIPDNSNELYEAMLLDVFKKLKKRNDIKRMNKVQECVEKCLSLPKKLPLSHLSNHDAQLAKFAQDVRIRLTAILDVSPKDYIDIATTYVEAINEGSVPTGIKGVKEKVKSFFTTS